MVGSSTSLNHQYRSQTLTPPIADPSPTPAQHLLYSRDCTPKGLAAAWGAAVCCGVPNGPAVAAGTAPNGLAVAADVAPNGPVTPTGLAVAG